MAGSTINITGYDDTLSSTISSSGANPLTVIAPYYSSVRAWQDPTHKRAISEYTFLYFNKQWREVNKLDQYGIKSDFDFTYGYQLDNEWLTKNEEQRNFAIKHYINVIQDIQVTLVKRNKL